MREKITLLVFAYIYVVINIASASPTSVPLNDPIYPFLDRMETLGHLHTVQDGIKPFSHSKVAGFLEQLEPLADRLTPIDRRRLQDFLLDYRRELEPERPYHRLAPGQDWYSVLGSWDNFKSDFARYFRREQPQEEDHVLLYEKGGDSFYFDYEQGLTYEQRSDNVYRSASWQAYILRGTFADNFGFQARTELQGIRGDEPYLLDTPILKGSWSQLPEDGPRFADRTGGELYWHSEYLDIQFAQQEIEWGYGTSGKLILSRNVEQFPYLSFSKDWGWVKFISIQGKLQSYAADTLSDGQQQYPDKWLAAQRLELTLWRQLTLGLNENFIYGNRYVDWAYFFPLNFYRATQHKLRDRDNATISVDMEWLARPGIKLYGTVFLDEFRMSEIGSNWFGNKHAFQGGLFLADPFGLTNLGLRAEYTAIMPWVYTHKYSINSYTSDYQSLGHWAGPNSEVWYVELKKEWHQRFSTTASFRQWKHGANPANENIGGDILLGRSPETMLGSQTMYKDTREFLEGDLTNEQRFRGEATWEMFNDMYLTAAWNHFRVKNAGVNKNLNEVFAGILFRY